MIIPGNLVLGSCSDWKDLSGGRWPCWASPQVWFTVVSSINTGEEPSSRGSISLEWSCLASDVITQFVKTVLNAAEGLLLPEFLRMWSYISLSCSEVVCCGAVLFPCFAAQLCWCSCHRHVSSWGISLWRSPLGVNTQVEAAWMGALFVGCPNLSEVCRKFGCSSCWDLEFTWGFS